MAEQKVIDFEFWYNHPICKTCPEETKQHCLTPGNPGSNCLKKYVTVIQAGTVQCPKCGHKFCPASSE